MKRNNVTFGIFLSLIIFLSFIPSRLNASEEESEDVVPIQSMQTHVVVKDDATLQVNETVVIDKAEEFTYTKDILTNLKFSVSGDEKKDTFVYAIKDVETDFKHTITTSENYTNLAMEIPANQKEITYSYTVILPKISVDNSSNVFYYAAITGNQVRDIENFSMSIEYQKPITSNFKISLEDASGYAQEDFISVAQDTNLVTITSNQTIPSHYRMRVENTVPTDYFIFKKQSNLQLYTLIGTIVAVAISYYFIFYNHSHKRRDKDRLYYPPADIPVPYAGYIMDKEILGQDLFTQILLWANAGYVEVVKKKDEVFINITKELPATACAYEKDLFDVIFMSSTSVRLVDLQERDTIKPLAKISSSMALNPLTVFQQPIYSASTKFVQLLNVFLISLPIGVLGLATFYMNASDPMTMIRNTIVTIGIVALAILPFAFLLRRRHVYAKSNLRMMQVLSTLWLVMLISMISVFLINQGTKSIYLIILGIVCAIYAFSLLFATKRSRYGKDKYYELTSIKHFMGFVKEPHLRMLQKQDPNYFFEVLPLSYIYGNVETWFQKFKAIRVQQPTWFYTDNDKTSWFIQLQEVLTDLYIAITKEQPKN